MAEPEDGRGGTAAGEHGGGAGVQMETESQPAASRAGYARSQVRSRMDGVRGQVREKAGELKEQAGERADAMTSRAGSRVSGVARALRRAGDELRTEGDERLAAMTQDFAGQIERLGGYLDGEKPGAMMEDLERMARRNPALFVGGTFAAGLLLGRFLRSDEPRDEVDILFEPEGNWAENGAGSRMPAAGFGSGGMDEGPYPIGGDE